MVTKRIDPLGNVVLIEVATGDPLVIVPVGVDLHPDVEVAVEQALVGRGYAPDLAASLRAALRPALVTP